MAEVTVKGKIRELFVTMNQEIDGMVANSCSTEKAIEDIIGYVSRKLAASSRGYISSLYTTLSDKTLSEPEFQSSDHANRFFDLELDRKMEEAYKYVKELPQFSSGINCKGINRCLTSALTGTVVLGGSLLWARYGSVHIHVKGAISVAVIVVLVWLAGFAVCYFVVPKFNRRKLSKAVKPFMSDLEQEMYKWADDVTAFYNTQVEELKRSF